MTDASRLQGVLETPWNTTPWQPITPPTATELSVPTAPREDHHLDVLVGAIGLAAHIAVHRTAKENQMTTTRYRDEFGQIRDAARTGPDGRPALVEMAAPPAAPTRSIRLLNPDGDVPGAEMIDQHPGRPVPAMDPAEMAWLRREYPSMVAPANDLGAISSPAARARHIVPATGTPRGQRALHAHDEGRDPYPGEPEHETRLRNGIFDDAEVQVRGTREVMREYARQQGLIK